MHKYQFDPRKVTPLCEIMGKHNSDKGGSDIIKAHHNYTTLYYSIFKDIKNKELRIFELGLGTINSKIPSNMCFMTRYIDSKYIPGASIRGWVEFFQNSKVFGADIDKTILFEEPRIKTFFCDQTKPDVIKNMWNEENLEENFDIIIDDGLHNFNANVCFFENSIHKLKPGGYYIIEDVLTKELFLFENKLKIWRTKYTYLDFTILKIPSTHNNYDNNLIVIKDDRSLEC